jgi:hypothetical protein
MPQTSIQKEASIRFGSGKLEMGASFGALTNLGAVRNLQFNSLKEDVEIPFDNTNPLKKFIKGIDCSITVDIAEVDMTTFSLTDAGWAVVTATAGAIVAGATDTLGVNPFVANYEYDVLNQNSDLSVLTINSVTGGTDGALTADDDYHLVKNANNGHWCIVMNTVAGGGTLSTLAQTITVDYDYTPAASKDVTFNDFGTKTLKVARITNTDSSGNTFVMDIENVTNTEPWVLPFVADDANDVSLMSLTLTGTITSITDQQSTT